MKLIFYIISIIAFADDYLRFALKFPYIYVLPIILSFFTFFVITGYFRRRFKSVHKYYALIITFYICVCLVFLWTEPLPFIYEIFKILTFLYFIPFFSCMNRLEIESFLKIFIRVGIIYLTINFGIMLLQACISEDIVSYFMMPTDIYLDSQKSSRYMALFGNLPALAMTVVCFYILIDFYHYETKKKKYLKIMLFMMLILSTSKAGLIIFLVYYIYKYKRNISIKNVMLILIFMLLASYFLLNDPRFINKIDQIKYIMSLDSNGLNNIGLGAIGWRAYCYIIALNIFPDNIFGIGLGTWGSFSSTYNKNLSNQYNPIHMSDSALSHLIVEQGIFLIIYFIIIIYPGFMNKNQKVKIWSMVAILSFTTTMGFLDTSWPIVFAICYSLSIFYEKDDLKSN